MISRLSAECRPFARTVRIKRPFANWPAFLRDGDTAEVVERKGMKLYCCPGAIFAIDLRNTKGYFWHESVVADCVRN